MGRLSNSSSVPNSTSNVMQRVPYTRQRTHQSRVTPNKPRARGAAIAIHLRRLPCPVINLQKMAPNQVQREEWAAVFRVSRVLSQARHRKLRRHLLQQPPRHNSWRRQRPAPSLMHRGECSQMTQRLQPRTFTNRLAQIHRMLWRLHRTCVQRACRTLWDEVVEAAMRGRGLSLMNNFGMLTQCRWKFRESICAHNTVFCAALCSPLQAPHACFCRAVMRRAACPTTRT